MEAIYWWQSKNTDRNRQTETNGLTIISRYLYREKVIKLGL